MRFGYTSLIKNWPNNPHQIYSLKCETQNALIQCAIDQMNNYIIKKLIIWLWQCWNMIWQVHGFNKLCALVKKLYKISKNMVNYIKVHPKVLEMPDDLKQNKNSFIINVI